MRQGFAVIDGVLPPPLTAALRAELDTLRATPGLTRPNSTHLVVAGSGSPQLLEKAHIVEAEISRDDAARAAAPLFAQVCCGGCQLDSLQHRQEATLPVVPVQLPTAVEHPLAHSTCSFFAFRSTPTAAWACC